MLAARQAASGEAWCVLSGAGMSTASGIPDYRGPDGLRRVEPMTIQEFRHSPAARRRYWARSYVGWQRFAAAGPNPAHRAVTDLQRLGVVSGVITQNVDGLHQAAGTASVVELHGSLATVVCDTCGLVTARSDLDAALRQHNPDFDVTSDEIRPDGDISLHSVDVERFVAPVCQECRGDELRPNVVFFGDSVPRERVDRCQDMVLGSCGLLVLGSSLAVMSGLRFARQASRQGIPVVIVTSGPSRGDDLATLRSHRPLEQVLPATVRLLAVRVASG